MPRSVKYIAYAPRQSLVHQLRMLGFMSIAAHRTGRLLAPHRSPRKFTRDERAPTANHRDPTLLAQESQDLPGRRTRYPELLHHPGHGRHGVARLQLLWVPKTYATRRYS